MTLRKLTAALVICMLGIMCRAYAGVAVNMSAAVLYSDEGEVIIPAGVYERITPLEGGLYAARGADGRLSILDESGSPLTESVYSDVCAGGGRLILSLDGRYGVTDYGFSEIIPFEYSFIAFADGGRYLALKGDIWDDIADMLYLLDEDGTCEATGTRLMYPVFALTDPGSACLSGVNGRWGYIAPDGSWQTDSMFMAGGHMINGMAAVTLTTGSGVINSNGDWLITPFCDSVILNEYLIITSKNGLLEVYTRDSEGCRKVYSAGGLYASAAGRYACLYADDTAVLYDTQSGRILAAGTDAYWNEGWDGCLIGVSGGTMYLYRLGEGVISDKFESINRVCEGFYSVYELIDDDVTAGLIGKDGDNVLECRFKTITSPAAGYIAAEDAEGIHLYRISESGVELIA